MNRSKIYVYAICKNEEAFVDRWMDSVGEADGIVVVDTGSTDDTVARLRARGADVYEETFHPWRFDSARNAALSHVPKDADICVSNDIDEVFEPGWRQSLERAWDEQCTRAKYWFVWDQPSDGSPEKKFIMEKIHLRHNFKWIHPVHEVLEYSGTRAEKSVFVEDVLLIHKPDPQKSRGQYLPLLELAAVEDPNDDRTKFWLGREYIFNGHYDKGIATLKAHLKMPRAIWDEERSASMRFIARAYRSKNDVASALEWLYRAIGECPKIREPWLELAQLGYNKHNWPLTLWAAEQGLSIANSTESYLVETAAWGYMLDDYATISAYWLNLYDKAIFHAQAACDKAPDNERLQENLQFIKNKVNGGGALA